MARLTRRALLRAGTVLAAAGGAGLVMLAPRRTNAYYAGPVSDHFDGLRFFNPGGDPPKGLKSVLRLYGLEPSAAWPAHWPSPFADRPPRRVGAGALRVAHVGHASFLVQGAGLNIVIDPHWSERASPFTFAGPKRVNPPGIAFDDLPPIDVVLVTHNHYDHMDMATLARLWQRDRPRIVTPLGNDTIMAASVPGLQASAHDWHETVEFGPRARVHLVPTQHWSARGTTDRSHALWASFVLELDEVKLYAVGDSGFGGGRTFRHVAQRHPRLDLALLPIGAYEPRWFMRTQHMNPDDTVRAFRLSGAARALGHHWGTFKLTTEAIDAPPKALAVALEEHGVDPARFEAMQPGRVVEFGSAG